MDTVVRRRKAQQDLFELWDWRASTYNVTSADKLVRAITKAMRFLAEHPLSGRPREDIRPGLRSHTVRKYVILYYPQTDGILVSRVLFGGRDIEHIYEDEDDEDT